jgi:hypothetical protein
MIPADQGEIMDVNVLIVSVFVAALLTMGPVLKYLGMCLMVWFVGFLLSPLLLSLIAR